HNWTASNGYCRRSAREGDIRMKHVLFALSLLLPGCNVVWDDEAPDIALVGTPPPTDSLPRLNRAPAGQAQLLYGYRADGTFGALWVAFTEPLDTPAGRRNGLRAIRLEEPSTEEILPGDEATIGFYEYYLLERDRSDPMGQMKLTVRSPGQTTAPEMYVLPP